MGWRRYRDGRETAAAYEPLIVVPDASKTGLDGVVMSNTDTSDVAESATARTGTPPTVAKSISRWLTPSGIVSASTPPKLVTRPAVPCEPINVSESTKVRLRR